MICIPFMFLPTFLFRLPSNCLFESEEKKKGQWGLNVWHTWASRWKRHQSLFAFYVCLFYLYASPTPSLPPSMLVTSTHPCLAWLIPLLPLPHPPSPPHATHLVLTPACILVACLPEAEPHVTTVTVPRDKGKSPGGLGPQEDAGTANSFIANPQETHLTVY